MPIIEMRHRLRSLGWKALDNGRQLESGRWCLSAASCGHIIVAFADSRKEVWSAACSMALQLTRDGLANPKNDFQPYTVQLVERKTETIAMLEALLEEEETELVELERQLESFEEGGERQIAGD